MVDDRAKLCFTSFEFHSRRLLFGDIRDHSEGSGDHPDIVHYWTSSKHGPEDRAVAANKTEVVLLANSDGTLSEAQFGFWTICLVHEYQRISADHLALIVSQHFGHSFVHILCTAM